MIGKLTGIIDEINLDHLILDVGGVGYKVQCPTSTLDMSEAAGEEITLWIETQMNEHSLTLYGFTNKEQLEWFRLLVSVHGVGYKMALGILGGLSPTRIAQAIGESDSASLTQISGLGKKLAARIINELKNKIPTLDPSLDSTSITPLTRNDTNDYTGAVSALVHLGYPERHARATVSKIITANQNISLEEMIRASLKELNR